MKSFSSQAVKKWALVAVHLVEAIEVSIQFLSHQCIRMCDVRRITDGADKEAGEFVEDVIHMFSPDLNGRPILQNFCSESDWRISGIERIMTQLS